MSTTTNTNGRTRQDRADNTTITAIREIDASARSATDPRVFEVDLINERGEVRENVTIIPRLLYESTKDVQYRGDSGIIGKYTRALVSEHPEAYDELCLGIAEEANEVTKQQRRLRQRKQNLATVPPAPRV